MMLAPRDSKRQCPLGGISRFALPDSTRKLFDKHPRERLPVQFADSSRQVCTWVWTDLDLLRDSVALRAPDAEDWYGSLSASQVQDMLRHGDRESSAQALAQYKRALKAVLPSTEGRRPVREFSVVGGSYSAARVNLGHPTAYRRRLPAPGPGKVRLFVDNATSAGLGQETLLARGIAVAALVRAVSVYRPVELWSVTGGSTSGWDMLHVWQVPTQPLDLSKVAAHLTRVGLHRRIYPVSGVSLVGWPGRPVRESLALGKQDVYVQPLHMQNAPKMMKDPMAWLLDGLANQLRDADITWGGKGRVR